MKTLSDVREEKNLNEAKQDYFTQKELKRIEELKKFYATRIEYLKVDAITAVKSDCFDLAISALNNINTYKEKLRSL